MSKLRAVLLIALVLAVFSISLTRSAGSQTPTYDHKSMHSSACRYVGYPHPIGQPAGTPEYLLERVGEIDYTTSIEAWPQYSNPATVQVICPIPRDVVVNASGLAGLVVNVVDNNPNGYAQCTIVNVSQNGTINYGTIRDSGLTFAGGYKQIVWTAGFGTAYTFGTTALSCSLHQNVAIIGYRYSEFGGDNL